MMLDLILAAASVWSVFGMFEAGVTGPVRIFLGFFAVLFIPGYAFVSMVFGNNRDIDALARLGLSVGFSIAMVSISAYLLTYTPWELEDTPVFLTLSLMTTGFCGIAFWQRYRRSKLPLRQFISESTRFQLKALAAVRPIVAGASVASVLLVAVLLYFSQGVVSQPLTEFSVLSASGKTSDYETRLAVGKQVQYLVTIVNKEKEDIEYRLQLVPPDQDPLEVATFVLERGHKKELLVDYLPKAVEDAGKLQFLLYRSGESASYKTVYLLVTIAER